MMTTTPIIANLSRRKRRQISPHSERCSMSSASGLHMPAAPTAVPISDAPERVAQPEVDLGLGLEAHVQPHPVPVALLGAVRRTLAHAGSPPSATTARSSSPARMCG